MNTRETKSPGYLFLGRQRRKLLEQLEEVGKILEREELYLRPMGTLHPSDIADQAEEECEDQEVAETLPSLRARYEGIVEALRCLEECRRQDLRAYVGGMFEVDVGRSQARVLASLFTADAWNDLAPLVGTSHSDPDDRRAGFGTA